MSKPSVVIINHSNAESMNDLEDGTIVGIMPDTAECNDGLIEKVINIFKKDPKIGIVTSDILFDLQNGIEYIEYFLKKPNANIPIFLKKRLGMKINGKVKISDIIKSILANGLYIEHISDPEVKIKDERAIY